MENSKYFTHNCFALQPSLTFAVSHKYLFSYFRLENVELLDLM